MGNLFSIGRRAHSASLEPSVLSLYPLCRDWAVVWVQKSTIARAVPVSCGHLQTSPICLAVLFLSFLSIPLVWFMSCDSIIKGSFPYDWGPTHVPSSFSINLAGVFSVYLLRKNRCFSGFCLVTYTSSQQNLEYSARFVAKAVQWLLIS